MSMNVLRKEGKYELNEGYGPSRGLYNISSDTGGVTDWFDEEEKDRLMELGKSQFIEYAIQTVEEKEPKLYSATDMQDFGLFLGNNIKKYKNKDISIPFNDFING